MVEQTLSFSRLDKRLPSGPLIYLYLSSVRSVPRVVFSVVLTRNEQDSQ